MEPYIRNIIYGMLYTEYYIWNVINRTLLTEFMYKTLYGTLYTERCFIWNIVIYGNFLYMKHLIRNVKYGTLNTEL